MKELELRRNGGDEDKDNDMQRKANEEKKRQSEQPIIKVDEEITIQNEQRKKTGEGKPNDASKPDGNRQTSEEKEKVGGE